MIHPLAGQGLVYAARIRLNQRTILVRGRDQAIGPGLAVQAEIKTGERRISSICCLQSRRRWMRRGGSGEFLF